MAGQVLLIADRSDAVIQPGQPSAQMGAWILNIPDGSNALETAAAYADAQNFPSNTIARVIDLTTTTVNVYKLQSSWVAQ